MFLGLGLVAVWAHVRYPKLRPNSLGWAAAQVCISSLAFVLLPATLHLVLPFLQSDALRFTVLLALLMAGLTYVLLSWVWLIAYILRAGMSGPSGGHRIRASGR